ncbi:hypothetical protein M378DRAFT_320102 [Amanita muscaria Koide BX008]|uniref:Uncharacterized protein n=1 Tax=Amanita muscaria (strain Koide BX008) TaxID=946122 RepID=A0A0C2WYP2_AMAMK|nr:hypothetical protein M378DRAFT_320102 [Amanita muscaria Koide BX008]
MLTSQVQDTNSLFSLGFLSFIRVFIRILVNLVSSLAFDRNLFMPQMFKLYTHHSQFSLQSQMGALTFAIVAIDLTFSCNSRIK